LSRLISNRNGNTTAWAWRNCSTVTALAITCNALSTTSSPRAIRAMMESVKFEFHNYGTIEQEIELLRQNQKTRDITMYCYSSITASPIWHEKQQNA
jgi:hypothetical protein